MYWNVPTTVPCSVSVFTGELRAANVSVGMDGVRPLTPFFVPN